MSQNVSPFTVSTIIPSYNGERYLAEALESVLAQELPPTEIIVIDDGSIDGTTDIARSYPQVRLHSQKNKGIGASRNIGVNISSGDVIAFLDHDDIWTADKLRLQLSALEEMPDIDMVFGMVQEFYSPEIGYVSRGEMPIRKGLIPSSWIVRRTSFQKVGFFDVHYDVGEFIDWYSRACELGLKSYVVPKVLVKRRLHKTNTGIVKSDSRKGYVRILKKALDRRRKSHALQSDDAHSGDDTNPDN